MLNHILLDTNYVIKYSSGEYELKSNQQYFISRITYLEYLSCSEFSDHEIITSKKILKENFTIIEIDEFLCDLAANLRRIQSGLKNADSIILATSIDLNARLQTLDKRLQNYHKKLSSEFITQLLS